MNPRIAFIDHHYHIKTRSGDFLRKILQSHFKIDNYWVNNNLKLDEKIFKYENLFFFQILPSFQVLKKLKNKNIVWAPMYDSPHYPYGYSWALWKIIEYLDIKILSFSKKITNQLKNFNIKQFSLTFYKKTKNKKINKKINIFFWNRGDIKISDWIKSINFNYINKVYYLNLDGAKPEGMKLYKEKIIMIKKNFSPTREFFLKLLEKCEVFVCPRRKEGIGMAQVEALSMGKYLLAHKDSTMDDYIVNEKIGVFFNEGKDQKNLLKKKNIINFKNYRLNYNKNKYSIYLNKKKKILDFFFLETKKFYFNFFLEILVFFIYVYKVTYRKFCYYFYKKNL